MVQAKKGATPKVATKVTGKNPAAKTGATKAVSVHRNSLGKWVYPQGQANVHLQPQPKSLGSNQLVHYTALKAAFGNKKVLPLPQLLANLAKANLGRRTLRRAGRAQGYTFIVK